MNSFLPRNVMSDADIASVPLEVVELFALGGTAYYFLAK